MKQNDQINLNRREFLGRSLGVGGAWMCWDLFGWSKAEATTYAESFKLTDTKESLTICPYCGVGCGMWVHTRDNKVVNLGGDPDHPINEGALCSKGNALQEISWSPRRLRKVKYRAPGSSTWVEKDMSWAIAELAQRIKKTRDASFLKTDDAGTTVNRTENLAVIGGASLDNEECYLIYKLTRALGVVYFEHQARVCHSSTVGALGPSFGRGAMTNHWIDIKNADVVFIIGSNPAENHPMSFRWITRAREERGAKVIVADPRFTRSASLADLYVRHRPGTDIALINGMINYALENNLIHEDYVREYTNASFLVNEGFKFEDGLFTGYDAEKRNYDTATWNYQKDATGNVIQDKTLKNSRTVFSLLKAHMSRYTLDMVSKVTGVDKGTLDEMYKLYCSTGAPDKTGTILYAMGATQHTVGVQYIRGYAILQLLLGNIGVAGGGINAMRGESNVQGSTDMALLAHLVPGYMAIPNVAKHPTLKDYLEKETPKTGYWINKPKFFVSFLKAMWGDAATQENDFCYNYMPKVGKGFQGAGYSWLPLFEALAGGNIKGMMVWGMNPAVSSPNVNKAYRGFEKLEWLAAFDLWETETASFWKRPGADPSKIQTEVFLFPAAASFEKEGSITNSGRWIQWRTAAVPPLGEAKSDLWYLNAVQQELSRLYAADAQAIFPDPIVKLNWDYGKDEPDVHLVAREINGYTVADKKQVANFTKLAEDGSTACGNWIYSGFYPGSEKKDNLAARRGKEDKSGLGLYPMWSYAWPVNRRIVYNRASADLLGRPWDPKRELVRWDVAKGNWVNSDVPDFGWKDAKTGEQIPPDKSGSAPYIMLPELKARLFVPNGVVRDGPYTEHYEPLESPVKNLLSSQQNNPVIKIWKTEGNDVAGIDDPNFPLIATTFRLTEHWQAGAMTRNLSLLTELMPEMFVEMSPELASAKGIVNDEWVLVVSARGQCRAKANVSPRMKAVELNGVKHEMVALPWHFGYQGLTTGGPAGNNYAINQITPSVGDANTMIPEYKAFLCDVRKI